MPSRPSRAVHTGALDRIYVLNPETYPMPLTPSDPDQPFAGEQDADPVKDAFKRLIYLCVPPKTYGQVRLGPAAYRRFIATIWIVTPEVFEGRTQEQMAEMCGMSLRAFKYTCANVNAAIASRKKRK